MKVKAWTRYKTQCGFIAEVYRTTAAHYTESTNYGQAIGAVLIEPHPAVYPGWLGCEWDAETGVAVGSDGRDRPYWDLVEELGPIKEKA